VFVCVSKNFIILSGDAVDGPNSLLVVNGRVHLNQRPVRQVAAGRNKEPTVVEAANVMHAYAVQR
jgi:hypothetical protein